MIDFLILLLIVVGVVAVVRRLRRYGFAGLRPPPAFARALAVQLRPTATLMTTEVAPATTAAHEFQTEAAAAARVTTAPPIGRPRLFVGALGLAVMLLIAAMQFERELWGMTGDLLPFWGLLACGVGFAAIVRLGLAPAEPPETRGTPLATEAPLSVREFRRQGVALLRRLATLQPNADVDRGLFLAAAAVACELLALLLFERGELGTIGWILHLTAGPMFLWAVWRTTRERLARLAGTWSRVDSAAVVGLVAVGLAVRLWHLSDVPAGVWFDEATRGLDAIRIVTSGDYRPVFDPGIINQPAGLSYLVAPFVQVLGRDPAALRLPSAIAGALDVGAIYVLARLLFGRRAALIAAGLMIGMTWQVNFSRFAMNAIVSVFLNTLSVTLLVLGFQRRSQFAFAAGGLIGGAAIHFYNPSQLVPIVILALTAHRLATERSGFFRVHGVGLVIGGFAFLLAMAPIAKYAVAHPGEFTARAGTVTVFKEVQQTGNWDPVTNNLKAHLLMFNVRGDPNGRHNWTGRPMLDGVTGALAVLGLALALTHWRRIGHFLPLAWFAVMLAGGVFSLSFEAPQSHRTIDEVTAVALLAALPLTTLGRAGDLVRRVSAGPAHILPRLGLRVPRSSGLSVVSCLATVCLVAGSSAFGIWRYFTEQQQDFRTWSEFSTPQTEAGRLINEIPQDWRIYLDPFLNGNPSVIFMVRKPRSFQQFDPAGDLPITDDGAAVFLTDHQPSVAARLATLYPAAKRQLLYAPNRDTRALYVYFLAPADLVISRGVLAHYGPLDDALERTEPGIDFPWPAGAALTPPFPATLEATLNATKYGTYRFKLEGPADAAVILDGLSVLKGAGETRLTLARGAHALRVEAPAAGLIPLRLLWQPPGGALESVPGKVLHVAPIGPTGLLARLFRGEAMAGDPAIEQIDPTVELDVQVLPLPRPYSVEWSGSFWARAEGTYKFGTLSIDSSSVAVDGREIVSNSLRDKYVDGSIALSAGWHDIRVRFLDATNSTRIRLYWEPPGAGRAIIPSEILRPWSAERAAVAVPSEAHLSSSAPPLAPGGSRQLAPPGTLVQPRGAAVAPDGTVYVADPGRQAVVALAPDGTSRLLAGGQFKEPSAVAVLRDRSLVVLDAGAGAAWRVDPSGVLGERLAPGESLYGPRGIAAAADGRMAIADTGNSRVLILSPGGAVTNRISGLKQPTDAAFLPDGNILVAETEARQLTVVRVDGQRVAEWQMPDATTVVGPHLALLPDGGWVVTAPETHALLRLLPNSRSLQPWTPNPGLQKPVGIALGPSGIVVVDSEAKTATLLALP